jgi:hypothetical protein
VLDGVCVVRAGLFKKPLEVIRRLHRTLAAARVGRGVSRIGAGHLPIVVVIADGRGPLKVLHASLVTAFDDLLCVVSSDIEQCLLVAPRGRLPASLCWVKHDRLITGGTGWRCHAAP